MSNGEDADLTLEGLVHDLNNVFQTISEAAELVARDAALGKAAAAIQRSVERGRRLVRSVHETSAASFDLEMIVASAMEFSRDYLQAARQAPLDFSVEIEPGTRLRGNPVGWERVLVNLFLNAAQAMRQKGVEGNRVEVRSARVDDALEITVADEGPGIPADILARIFEPGFSTKSRRSAQSGLGLHIVESIVHANGGVVTAANRVSGTGAEIRIRLPQA